jgi:hypothetical protein
MAVPIYEAFNVRIIDPIIHSILEEQGKYLNKTFDRTLISVQNKIFAAMGHMCHLWKLLEDIRMDNERVCMRRTLLTLLIFVRFSRRVFVALNKQMFPLIIIGLDILKKINEDSKKARTLLRDNQEGSWIA